MPDYFYHIDGIRHDIKALNDLPPRVRKNGHGEIHISRTQHRICRDLKMLLIAWKQIADALDIKWFMNGGSLLGTLRDKGLIFYDNDVDLVVQIGDYDKLLNYQNTDGFSLTESEAGFQFARSDSAFPFVDIWIIGPDPMDASKMCACGPVFAGKPSFYLTNVWPNEWYYAVDLKRLQIKRFENIDVFIPTNAKTTVQRMYGQNCLVEYRMESHTDDHQILATLFPVECRVTLERLVKKTNGLFGLDLTRNVDGHLSCLVAKLTAELTVVSGTKTSRAARITKHVVDYVGSNLLENLPTVTYA